MVVHKCDRCGKIVERQKGITSAHGATIDSLQIAYVMPSSDVNGRKIKVRYERGIDLCDNCLDFIIGVIANGKNIDFDDDSRRNDQYIGRVID